MIEREQGRRKAAETHGKTLAETVAGVGGAAGLAEEMTVIASGCGEEVA